MSYTKQYFEDGQVLEAGHLNRIEEGIVANEAAIADKQPKGDYATKTDLAGYQPKGDYLPGDTKIPTKVSELTNDKSYATESYVVGKINEAALSGGEVDMSAYPTKQEVAEGYQPKGNYLTEHQSIKTLNGQSLVGTGNIDIEGGTKKSISILFVGNSLTQDGIAYLPYMLKNYYPEVDFRIYMWYTGGYTLAQHYSTFTSGGKAGIFSVAENSETWTNYNSNKTMANVLSTYTFDIVCMQEYFNVKTEYTDATDWNNCKDYIVSNYKGGNALEFISLFHAPWRRDQDDTDGVYEMTEYGNGLILQTTISQDMIPNGIAVYRALSTELDSLGDKQHLSPDGVHTQEGLPCLMQTYVTLCWLFDRLGINKSIYGSPMRMTTEIYNKISVPGANLGTGVVKGTDAQNLLAQEIAIKAYKEGKQFVMKNFSPYINFGGGSSDVKYTFTIVPVPSDAKVVINGVERTTIEVQEGKNVSWEVSKDGYIRQSGIEAVNYDLVKTITLDEAIVVDSATQAYIDATGISEVAMIEKLDTMVTSLKTEGLWDKIDALYPCVGSTFNQMSYNLKDVSKYKLSASSTPEVTPNVGFYSTAAVTSAYNGNRLGTDYHTLGVSGTTSADCGSGLVSPGGSSFGGYTSSGTTTNNGVLAYYNNKSAAIRTASQNSWSFSGDAGSIPDHGLFIGSLSSGIVYNGADLGATQKGTPNLESYPDTLIHNGFQTDVNKFSNPFQVRLSGFGAALTIAEMQKYSQILNAFKSIY